MCGVRIEQNPIANFAANIVGMARKTMPKTARELGRQVRAGASAALSVLC
jgi:hypothetical protein